MTENKAEYTMCNSECGEIDIGMLNRDKMKRQNFCKEVLPVVICFVTVHIFVPTCAIILSKFF